MTRFCIGRPKTRKAGIMIPDEITRQREILDREREALDHRERELRDTFCAQLREITVERERLATEQAILQSLERQAACPV